MRSSLLCLALLLGACSSTLKTPSLPDESLLEGAESVPTETLSLIDGFYDVEGTEFFGDQVILAHRGAGVSLFAGVNNAYALMEAGCIEGGARLVLEGVWRFGNKSTRGTMRIEIGPPEAAALLCSGDKPEDAALTVTVDGALGLNSDEHTTQLSLTRSTPLVPPESPFLVIAHRGGCRTIDACGAAENSIEVIKLAEPLGANVIEIDVMLTADGVPILYHDTAFSDRLTEGLFCVGPVAEFPLAHVRELCRLTNGEEIPTLREALEAVIHETTLKGVWLDIKALDALEPTIELAREMALEAEAAGRKVQFIHGLWSNELVHRWNTIDPPERNCLVELEPAKVGRAGCEVWAPRWTLGPMADQVAEMQAQDRMVTFWTVDELVFVDTLLRDSTPDGLLTNRPGLVFYQANALRLEEQLAEEEAE